MNVDQDTVINFIQSHIMCRFVISETLTTDQSSLFIGRKIVEFASKSGIKLLNSTPYYAQANDKVKAKNKIIIGLIKKHVG